MKKIVLLITLFCLSFTQSKSQIYVSLANTIYTSPGSIGDKASPAIEVGKQFGPLSVGFDMGRINCSHVTGKDTTLYLEVRPNINVFQQGSFTNTLTIGVGALPTSNQYFMAEFSSGIEYAMTETWHINMNFGQYYLSGQNSSQSLTFVGLSVIYYLKPFKIKS